MTHLTRGLEHLRPRARPERLRPSGAVDVLERLEGPFRAVGAHARLPHLERHPERGRLQALDHRADQQIHGRHDCVVVSLRFVTNRTRESLGNAVDTPSRLGRRASDAARVAHSCGDTPTRATK